MPMIDLALLKSFSIISVCTIYFTLNLSKLTAKLLDDRFHIFPAADVYILCRIILQIIQHDIPDFTVFGGSEFCIGISVVSVFVGIANIINNAVNTNINMLS